MSRIETNQLLVVPVVCCVIHPKSAYMFGLLHNVIKEFKYMPCHLLLLFCSIKCYQIGTKAVLCELNIERLTIVFAKAA